MKDKLNKYVLVFLTVDGFHYWKNAPESSSYLKQAHRHKFFIRTWFKVQSNDREVEFFAKQKEIEELLLTTFGFPCNFEHRSCEDIATFIIKNTNSAKVEVLEDGFYGAIIEDDSQ